MNKLTGWTRFAPLMVGVVALLVLSWTPVASAGKAEDRVARIAARQEQMAARQAERAAKIAAREEQKAARAAKWAEQIAAWEAEQAALKAAWEAERVGREEQQAAKRAERAAKRVARDLLRGTDSKMIGPEGGTLMVSYRGGRGGKDNVRARFTVPRNALPAPVEISMTLEVDTQDLSYVKVIFGPSGLKFDIPAQLKVKLGRDVAKGIGYQSMVGLHHSKKPDDAGELVEEVPLTIEPGWLDVEVQMQVPGFSRYSLAGRV